MIKKLFASFLAIIVVFTTIDSASATLVIQKGKGKVYHVGMYIGDGKMIHAPNSSKKIEIIPVDIGVYKTNYAGARRYLQ